MLGGSNSSDHAAGRTRQNRVFRKQRTGVLQSSTGRHDPQSGLPPQRGLDLRQVGGEHRPDGSLHQRGLSSRNQARQRAGLMGTDHRLEARGSSQLRQSLFMHGITPGMHQSDCTRVDAGLVMTHKPLHETIVEPQCFQLPPFRIQTTGDLFNGGQQ